MKKKLLVTDNVQLFEKFKDLLNELNVDKKIFDFACSPRNKLFVDYDEILPLAVNDDVGNVLNTYNLIISLHSKQMFSSTLVDNVTCINVHPGYNPNNRGWFPQVFSIINDEIIGATIHIMDEELDHGAIIDRIEVDKFEWDTSETLYNRVIEAEIKLLRKNLIKILDNSFNTYLPLSEGKIFYKKDFNDLCEIDLDKVGSFREFYDLIRALTHKEYKNAYIKTKSGEKVYIKFILEKN